MQNRIYEHVKAGLSIREVAEFYGLEVNRGGFTSCPFHADKTPSMKLYDTDNHYHCYGCGAHGDVISLVGGLFNLEPHEAVKKLAEDFGIDVDNKTYEKPSIKAKIERYSYAIKENHTYRLLADYCNYLRDCRQDYAPVSHNDEWNPLFVKSMELEKYEYYRDFFTCGTKDEKTAFMRDNAVLLTGIERTLGVGKHKACQELA